MKNISLFTIIFLCLIFFNNKVTSHPGRTNSEGCHNQKNNNTYHCHNIEKNNELINISGIPTVIDGDTIYIKQIKIRFSGIDTPEKNQTCDLNGKKILCGLLAKKILEKKISQNEVNCIEEGRDRYGRILAECFLNNESLSSYLVRAGYAFAYTKYSKKYINDEIYAKQNKLGLWRTNFKYPWDFRRDN